MSSTRARARSLLIAAVASAGLLLTAIAPPQALAAAETAERSVFQRWIGTTIVGAFLLGIVVAAVISWRRARRERREPKT